MLYLGYTYLCLSYTLYLGYTFVILTVYIPTYTSRLDRRIQVQTNRLWETLQHWILSYTGNHSVYNNLRQPFFFIQWDAHNLGAGRKSYYTQVTK